MGSPFDEQPGLQPAHDSAGVAQFPATTDARTTHWVDTQAVTVPQYEDVEKEVVLSAENAEKKPGNMWTLRLWIFVTVLAVLVIVGAVIGGVVGSRNAHSGNHDANNTRPGPTPEDKSNSTMLRQKSALTATGWRMGGTSYVQLFYQGKDNFVYYSGWDSSHRSWSTPTKLTIGATPDTPMAASLIFRQSMEDGHLPSPQVEFYYRNASDYVSGENFQSVFPDGLTDSIENSTFIMGEGSRLAAYWPAVVYQAKSSELELIWFNPSTISYDKSPHSLSALSAVGSSNTPIVVLPLRALHPTGNHTVAADLKLLYRRDDGKIYQFDRWANGTVTKNDALPGFTTGPDGSLAGFATARANDDSGALDTYALHQADNGTIMYSTDTDSSGWKSPRTDPVFDGADSPTNLACVTAAASTNPDIPLTSATDLNRCYFQKRGKIIEVQYDGLKWSTLGEVPIPS